MTSCDSAHLPSDATQAPVALVTGAGSGIGRALAVLLSQAGYRAALVSRRINPLEETASLCPGPTYVLPADVSDPASAPPIIHHVLSRWQRLDALFNVAGSAPLMPIEQITPAHWRACVDSNLSSAVWMTAAAWPVFQKQQSGFVGNVSSMASVDPFPGFAMYAAAKAGVNLFTHCVGQEGQAIHVRAVAVAPGAVETPMLRQNFGEALIGQDRTLTPESVAQVFIDCLQAKRPFRSGETIIFPSP